MALVFPLSLGFIIIIFIAVFVVAQSGNLSEFCGLVINENSRNLCYEKRVATAPSPLSVGEKQIQESNYVEPGAVGDTNAADSDLSACDRKEERVIPAGVKLGSYELGYRDDCYASVAEKKQDESICKKIKTPYFKDVCYMHVGEAKLSFSICDKSGEFKDQCYAEVNKSNPNMAVCEKIVTQDFKDSCYAAVAVADKNELTCGKIESNDDYWLERDYCYAKVAVLKQDMSICGNLKIQARNYCYATIGIDKRDLSICDKIEDTQYTTWKSDCYKSVNNPN